MCKQWALVCVTSGGSSVEGLICEASLSSLRMKVTLDSSLFLKISTTVRCLEWQRRKWEENMWKPSGFRHAWKSRRQSWKQTLGALVVVFLIEFIFLFPCVVCISVAVIWFCSISISRSITVNKKTQVVKGAQCLSHRDIANCKQPCKNHWFRHQGEIERGFKGSDWSVFSLQGCVQPANTTSAVRVHNTPVWR